MNTFKIFELIARLLVLVMYFILVYKVFKYLGDTSFSWFIVITGVVLIILSSLQGSLFMADKHMNDEL